MISDTLIQKLIPLTEEEKHLLSGNDFDRHIYMSGEQNIINNKLLLESGKLITIRPHTRFIDFPEHSHDYIEVVYMCEGSMTHIINGKEITLSQGELLFLSRHVRHSIKRCGERDIAVNFIMLPQFFENNLILTQTEETPLKKFVTDSLCASGGPDFLHFKVSGEIPVQNLVENLIWSLFFEKRNKRRINGATAELLFLHLLNYTDSLEYDGRENYAVMRILEYIEENYKTATLREAACLLHYDMSWISREIKRKTGKNYTCIVQEKRLSQAAFLLKNTELKVDDIALSVGYNNLSYFYRIFKEKYGMLPKKYRNCK